MDHIHLLGPSLANIAEHKAGIMRKGTICVTCEQEPDALEVLINQSRKLSAPLEIATDGHISSVINAVIEALPTIAHRTNTAMAVQVVEHVLQSKYGDQDLDTFGEQDVIRGLKAYNSPGSCQEIARSPHYYFLDTAHNTLSLPVALGWFGERVVSLDQQ